MKVTKALLFLVLIIMLPFQIAVTIINRAWCWFWGVKFSDNQTEDEWEEECEAKRRRTSL